ncbi:MAG: ribokinase [Pirellulaceae bacterium]
MVTLIVVGSINTDLVVRGPRLPQPGETVLGGTFYRAAGGKGANQAVAAARGGRRPVALVSAVGDDDFGREALAGLRREGIDCERVKTVAGEASGIALILVDQQGENCISVASGANRFLLPDDIDSLPDALLERASALLASLEVPLETTAAALRRARGAGLTTVLNPAPASPALVSSGVLEHVDLLTPNEHEAAMLTRMEVDSPEAAIEAGRMLRTLGCGAVVVTLGERGCVVVAEDTLVLEAIRVEPVDATAAGDAFSGVLAAMLGEGVPLPEAARRATIAAGLTVTRRGAQPSLPTWQEVEAQAEIEKRRSGD